MKTVVKVLLVLIAAAALYQGARGFISTSAFAHHHQASLTDASSAPASRKANNCVLDGYGVEYGNLFDEFSSDEEHILTYLEIPLAQWSADPRLVNSSLNKKIPVLVKDSKGAIISLRQSGLGQEMHGSEVRLTTARGQEQSQILTKLGNDIKSVKYIDLRYQKIAKSPSDLPVNHHLICDF